MATDAERADGPAARDEATAVLGEVLTWRLTEPEWEEVAAAVATLAAAAGQPGTEELWRAAGQPGTDALWRAAGELELHAPVRVKARLGDTPPLPAPLALRERIAELVRFLARPAGPLSGPA